MTTATFHTTLAYTGPSGEAVGSPLVEVLAPYTAQGAGTIDVPDTEAAATVHAVPMLATEATGVYIVNRTANGLNPGQDLQVKINGAAAASHRLAPGGYMVIANPASVGGQKLTAISLITTAIQAGDGKIEYRVFGS